jgi:tetratricopeptide (TPR) repeat protein
VKGFNQPQLWELLFEQAGELYSQGDEFGDNSALSESVAAYRVALEETTRARLPLDWATTQNNLGIALSRLGARESGTARLEEAVAAYRAALEERTRVRVPLDWATSTGNQGVTLRLLAERRGNLAMAEQALGQITAAFETLRHADLAPNAAYYEAQLPAARALVERLRKR